MTAIGNNLVEFDTTSGRLLAFVNVPRNSVGSAVLDSPVGIAATPDGSRVFVADEGKYNVLAIDPATNSSRDIEVGASHRMSPSRRTAPPCTRRSQAPTPVLAPRINWPSSAPPRTR